MFHVALYRLLSVVAALSCMPSTSARTMRGLVVDTAAFYDIPFQMAMNDKGFANQDDYKNFSLQFMKAIHEAFQQPSLGDATLGVVVVKQAPTPGDLVTLDAAYPNEIDMYNYLSAFQTYVETQNETAAKKWHFSLLLTGLDLYYDTAYPPTRDTKYHAVKEYSEIGGMCDGSRSAGIVEATSFDSVVLGVRNLASSLGVEWDGTAPADSCSSSGFMMREPPAGDAGPIPMSTWSDCSYEQLLTMLPGYTCLRNRKWIDAALPGEVYTASDQCAIAYGIGYEASTTYNPSSPQDPCSGLECSSSDGRTKLTGGSALEGTYCGTPPDPHKWCRSAGCVTWDATDAPALVRRGGWSPWQQDACAQNCIVDGVDLAPYERHCDNPMPVYALKCQGKNFLLETCNSLTACGSRKSGQVYADAVCASIREQSTSPFTGAAKIYTKIDIGKSCRIYCILGTGIEVDVGEALPNGTLCYTHTTSSGPVNAYCWNGECLRLVPVDGRWSDWKLEEKCDCLSSSINKDQSAYSRQCDNPPPLQGGTTCSGATKQYRDCNMTGCEEKNPGGAAYANRLLILVLLAVLTKTSCWPNIEL